MAGLRTPLAVHWEAVSGSTVTSFQLNGNTDTLEYIVQCPESDLITHLGFRYTSRTGTPPTYRISIQGVDGSGRADGVIKTGDGGQPASGTFTPPADATWNTTWRWIALQANGAYTVSRGQFIAIVIDYSSGTISGTDASTITSASNAGGGGGSWHFPYAIHVDAGSPTRQTLMPVVAWKSSTKTYGFPMETNAVTSFSSDTATTDERGTAFNLAAGLGDSYKVIGAKIVGTSGAAGKQFKLLLSQGLTGTSLLQDVTFDTDHVSAVATANRGWIVYFDEATLSTLTFGTDYVLSVQPQDTSHNMAIIEWTSDDAQDNGAWPVGTQVWGATRADAASNWTSDTTKRFAITPIFEDLTEPVGGGGGGQVVFGG